MLVGKPLGKRLFGRMRRRWEDTIEKDLRKIGCEDGRWMKLAQDTVQWLALLLALLPFPVPLSNH